MKPTSRQTTPSTSYLFLTVSNKIALQPMSSAGKMWVVKCLWQKYLESKTHSPLPEDSSSHILVKWMLQKAETPHMLQQWVVGMCDCCTGHPLTGCSWICTVCLGPRLGLTVLTPRHMCPEMLGVGFVKAGILHGEHSLGKPWHRASDCITGAGGWAPGLALSPSSCVTLKTPLALPALVSLSVNQGL